MMLYIVDATYLYGNTGTFIQDNLYGVFPDLIMKKSRLASKFSEMGIKAL